MPLASNAQSPYDERQLPMSLNDIIEELPKLTPEERRQIYLQIERLDGEAEFEATPAMLLAIEEGTRSVQTEPTYSLEEARQRVRRWASTASA
jgi:nucleoside-diphosphate-sugar epimerase